MSGVRVSGFSLENMIILQVLRGERGKFHRKKEKEDRYENNIKPLCFINVLSDSATRRLISKEDELHEGVRRVLKIRKKYFKNQTSANLKQHS